AQRRESRDDQPTGINMRLFFPTDARVLLALPLFMALTSLPAMDTHVLWRTWLCPFAPVKKVEAPGGIGILTSRALLPPVIDPAGPFCVNAASVTLTATPPGGTWSGPGIINAATGLFSPTAAGSGSHTITYTEAVTGSASITIVVWSAPPIVFISGDGTDCNGEA